jgi:CRP-like cAMP-binding protein
MSLLRNEKVQIVHVRRRVVSMHTPRRGLAFGPRLTLSGAADAGEAAERGENMVRIAFDKELVLSGHFLLRHLSREELRRLAATTTLSNHSPGAVIFQKGDPGDSMMAVIRGRVKICSHSIEGKELVLNIINRGGLFGEIALLDGEPRTADAIALEESDLLVLERSKFQPFLRESPDLALRLLAVVCKRLRETSEHLEDTLFLEAPSRLARCLCGSARPSARRSRAGRCWTSSCRSSNSEAMSACRARASTSTSENGSVTASSPSPAASSRCATNKR